MHQAARFVSAALLLLSACADLAAPRNAAAPRPLIASSPAVQPPSSVAAAAPAPPARLSSAGSFRDAAVMASERAAHTATALDAATVLISGGFAGHNLLYHASAERYDVATHAFTPTGAMHTGRASHTATRLHNGTVLIAGGFNGAYLDSAELYDPATGSFAATGSLRTARSDHVAVRLRDGRVLVVGGVGTGWTFLASAELYDPASGTWTPAGTMSMPRESHTMTLLADGSVLIAGGHQGRRAALTIYASAERYDPQTGAFTSVGEMTVARHKHDAVVLPDGDVLITGGSDARDDRGAYRSAERYRAATQTFEATAAMPTARYKHRDTSVALADGTVLIAGGGQQAVVYDPVGDTFHAVHGDVGTSRVARLFAAATLLPNGDVLLTGGYSLDQPPSDRAWLYSVRTAP